MAEGATGGYSPILVGTVTLPNVSDREEALEVLRRTIRQLESLGRRTDGQNDDLQEARELLEEWD